MSKSEVTIISKELFKPQFRDVQDHRMARGSHLFKTISCSDFDICLRIYAR